ncbi:MAG: N,N-dimethylformamidase beta subunit family domain-containing protein, partial [Streptosporangiaceae bacterium]
MTACYAWPVTVRAGAALRLHVSTEHARFGVRLFRYGATVTEVPSSAGVLAGFSLPLGRPDEAWGWPVYPIELSADLADGVYLAVPVPLGPDDRPEPVRSEPELANRKDACLFVLRRRAAFGPAERIIWYKLPTATYTAYNQIGGASLYASAQWARDWLAQGYVGSLQRPGNAGVGGRVMEGDAPDAYVRSSRRQVFAHWDA